MREYRKYIEVEILKHQDFQDFSKTDVENAIENCPLANRASFEELNAFIHKTQHEWLEKEYEHKTKMTLSEYVADKITEEYDVLLSNSVQKNEATGEWVYNKKICSSVFCSCCKAVGDGGSYCSHCGAKMEGGKRTE